MLMISNVDLDEPPEVAAARGVIRTDLFPEYEQARFECWGPQQDQ